MLTTSRCTQATCAYHSNVLVDNLGSADAVNDDSQGTTIGTINAVWLNPS